MTIFETEFLTFNAIDQQLSHGVFTVVADCAEEAIRKSRQRIMAESPKEWEDPCELDRRVDDIQFMAAIFKLSVDIE